MVIAYIRYVSCMVGRTHIPVKKKKFVEISSGRSISYDTYLRRKNDHLLISEPDLFKEKVCQKKDN